MAKDVISEPGGNGKPAPGRYVLPIFALALDVSIACRKDLFDEVWLSGEGDSGDGIGEWLLSEMDVGDASAIGDEVFHPKKEVSLLGPGDRGVFVISLGSDGSVLARSLFVARPEGCNDIVRCNPSLFGTRCALMVSWSLDSLACRDR